MTSEASEFVGFLRHCASTTLLTLLLLFTAIGLEYVGPIERYSLRSRLPGFLMNAAGTFVSLALVWPLGRVWNMIGVGPAITVPLWSWLRPLGPLGYAIQILVLVAIADFLAYWRHRAEHAWLWRIHVVHHAPRELHAANDIAHPFQAVYNFAFIAIPLSLIQIDGPEAPFMVGGIVTLASMYIHSPVEWHLGPLRRVIVDNRFHRIHHSLEPRHFDKNFGIFLSLWDHLFGTAYEPGGEWPAVGVAGTKPPRTVGDYLGLPFLSFGADKEPPSMAPPADALVDP